MAYEDSNERSVEGCCIFGIIVIGTVLVISVLALFGLVHLAQAIFN